MLSVKEVTTSAYGFSEDTVGESDKSRLKKVTDFALANGVYTSRDLDEDGLSEQIFDFGEWQLRSPIYADTGSSYPIDLYFHCDVWVNGHLSGDFPTYGRSGIVPALSISAK